MSIGNATWQTMALSDDVQEHWVLHLTDDLGNTLRLSTHPGMDGAAPVYPAVTAWGAIRRSIDLVKCVAKLENTTVTCCNMLIDGTALWDRLKPGATRKFINRDATLYSLLAGRTVSASAVATLRLISVSRPKGGKVVLSFEPRQPWDFIEVPSVKASSGHYFPIVYGDFSPNSSTVASLAYCTSMALWPAEVYEVGETNIRAIAHEECGSDSRPHVYEQSVEQFVPITDSASATYDTAADFEGGKVIQASTEYYLGIKGKGQFRDSTDNDWTTDPLTAVDFPREDDTGLTGAALTIVGNPISGIQRFYTFDFPAVSAEFYGDKTITVYIFYNWTTSNASQTLDLFLDAAGSVVGAPDGVAVTGSGFHTSTWTISGGTDISLLSVGAEVYAGTVEVYIYDVRVSSRAKIATTDKQSRLNTLQSVKNVYCGADGLTRSWTTGAVTKIHELHRDLIHRFTGYTATPTGWSALDTARTGWYCRWWQRKPRKLKDILEQAQYEGGFIWDWAPDGTGRYIYAKDSYSAGDVAYTLVETLDCGEIDRGHTAFSDLLTKQEISYDRHPADDSRFLSSYTHTNTTARTAWNIQTDENIAQVELEMLVFESAVQDHAAYHDTVRGDLRETFRLRIRRPRARILTIGDIVKVSSESAYHMVIGETRLPGSLDLETREVG